MNVDPKSQVQTKTELFMNQTRCETCNTCNMKRIEIFAPDDCNSDLKRLMIKPKITIIEN